MPRISRSEYKTSFFHVITQGINKQYIFEQNEYKKKYQFLLSRYLQKYNVNLLSYCVMSNHSPMLIYSEDLEQMSKYMHDVNTTYSKFYNESENRVGVVFRSRYKSEPIYDYKYLYNCVAYIHNNPVKAKIVDVPEKYEFSSYNSYINGTVSKKNIEILFESTHNYINLFKKIHNNVEIDNFQDYVEDVDYNRQLRKISNMNIGEIIMNKNELNETVKDLIENEKVPINKVCEIFKMSRYKIKKILENK